MDVQNDYYNAFYYRIQDIKNTRYPHIILDLTTFYLYMLKILDFLNFDSFIKNYGVK